MSFTDGDGTLESLTSEGDRSGRGGLTRPTAANGRVTASEDTDYTFAAEDFGFSGGQRQRHPGEREDCDAAV